MFVTINALYVSYIYIYIYIYIHTYIYIYTELSCGHLPFPLLFAPINEYSSIEPIWTYGDLISSLILKSTVPCVQSIDICYLLQGSIDF